MDGGIRLGRIAGVEVGLNWSLAIVFALIAWSLATVLLPGEAPGEPVDAYWTAATAGTVLFLASLLAHELGHALVARRLGVTVEGITLWLFGGVARLRGEAVSARAEARIAVVGPAVSFAIAAVFAMLAFGLDRSGAPRVAVGVAGWLAAINALLAIFNLVPAFPLDGGRVLRAILWRRSQSRARATVIAAGAGRVFGYLLVAFGLYEVFTGIIVGGIWSVFLGWFLLGAARTEESRVVLQDTLRGVRVRDVMSPDPVVAPGWITVDDFITRYVLTHRFTTFPLRTFEGQLEGLVTLARLKEVPPDQRGSTPVRQVARSLAEVPTAGADEPLTALLERMGTGGPQRALVLDGGKLIGIVSPADIMRALGIAALRGGRVASPEGRQGRF